MGGPGWGWCKAVRFRSFSKIESKEFSDGLDGVPERKREERGDLDPRLLTWACGMQGCCFQSGVLAGQDLCSRRRGLFWMSYT